MAQLYGPDLPYPVRLNWIMACVQRCEDQIWRTAKRIAKNGGNVVLDLGFMKARNRSAFTERARDAGISSELHFVTAPHHIRRGRVLARNSEQGETFSFEVSPAMFDFTEKEFEEPTDFELASATVFDSHTLAA